MLGDAGAARASPRGSMTSSPWVSGHVASTSVHVWSASRSVLTHTHSGRVLLSILVRCIFILQHRVNDLSIWPCRGLTPGVQ